MKVKNASIIFFISICLIFTGIANAQKVVIWQQYEPVPEILETFQDMYKELEKKLNVEIEVSFIPQEDMHQKLLTSIPGSNYPDLVFWFGQPGIEFSNLDVIAPLNDIVDKVGKDLWPGSILEAFQYPAGVQLEIPVFSRLWGMHYWKDWLVDSGIDAEPYTDDQGNLRVAALDSWEKVIETAQKLTKNTGDENTDKWGLGLQYSRKAMGDGSDWVYNMMVGHGATIGDTSKEIEFNSQESINAAQLMKDIYWKYKIVPEAVTGWDEYANNLYFQNRTVGIVMNGNSIISRLMTDDPDLVPNVGISIAPAGPKNRGLIVSTMNWTVFNTKNVDLAKEVVLAFVEDKELQLSILERMGKSGFYGPIMTNVLSDPYFAQLPGTIRMCMENSKYMVGPAYPYATTPESRVIYNSGVYVDIAVRLAVDDWSAEDAVKEAADKIKEIAAAGQ